MSEQDNSSPNEVAVISESAPETVVENAVVNTESAPVELDVETPATELVVEPEQSKAVKELIAQRKRRQQAEQEAAYYKGIAEGKGYVPPTQTKPEPVVAPQHAPESTTQPPSSDNFETWEAYERAKDEYLITQAQIRMRNEQLLFQQTQRQQAQHSEFEQRIEKFAEQDPTILSIRDDNTMPISVPMAEVIKVSEVAPELLKFLNANRKEALRIYGLPPVMAAREIGKIESSLQNAPKPTPPKRVSQAPEPIPTVTANGTTTVDEDNLPMDEYYRRYNQKRRR